MPSVSPSFPPSAFWDFSVETYARPGAAAACLALQDRLRADVNVVLFCCWAAASGRGRLDRRAIASVLAAVTPWQETVVAPLRAIRRTLKDAPAPAEAVRSRIAAVELEAEHAEQILIEATLARVPDPGRGDTTRVRDAASSLARYLAAIGTQPGVDDRTALASLIVAAFPGATRAEIDAALAGAIGG